MCFLRYTIVSSKAFVFKNCVIVTGLHCVTHFWVASEGMIDFTVRHSRSLRSWNAQCGPQCGEAAKTSGVSLPGSSRLWRSLSRLSRFPSVLKLHKNRQATWANILVPSVTRFKNGGSSLGSRIFRPSPILVPIALFSSLSRQGVKGYGDEKRPRRLGYEKRAMGTRMVFTSNNMISSQLA